MKTHKLINRRYYHALANERFHGRGRAKRIWYKIEHVSRFARLEEVFENKQERANVIHAAWLTMLVNCD